MTHSLSQPFIRGRRRTSAFTLVELMISIAMVLFLLIGVNQVFKMSADTVGSGMATSSGMRDLRAVRNTLTNDLTQMANPGSVPFIIIHNQLIPAYLNKQDMQAGGGTIPTNLTPDELVVPDRHAHRVDILEFFVNGGDYRRQSGTMGGNAVAFQGDLTSGEAFIHVGHLRVANNGQDVTGTATYPMPAAGTATSNANNLTANQFILGHQRILLSQKDSTNTVRDSTGTKQWYADTVVTPPTPNPPPPLMQPLAYHSPIDSNANSQVSVGGPKVFIESSLTDVAATSLGEFKTTATLAFKASPANAARQMIYQNNTPTLPGSVYRFAGKPWLDKSLRYAGSGTSVNVASQKLLLEYETALEAPLLLRGCSQFIVEFAGDYMQQNATGDWTANGANPAAPELDWNPVYKGGQVVGRTVRWYGMQRAANVPIGATGTVPADVMPVYWYLTPRNHVLASANRTNPNPAGRLSKTPSLLNPANVASFERTDLLATATPAANNFAYDCAWGPADLTSSTSNTPTSVSKAPWMIRITIRVDDPNGRLPEGQTMEFIYELPHAK